MDDQSPSKETLEVRKLDLEIQGLQARVGLEEERARLDVNNLRRTFRRTLIIAVLSASVPMIIAVLGWSIQNYQARRAASLTEEYRREERYNTMIGNLGNASPSSRLAAVSGLSEYALPGGRIGERQTSAEVINALTHRLASEDDAGVQQRILVTIGSVGKAALPHIANANRYAAGQFVQHSGELAGLLLRKRAPSNSDYSYAETKKIRSVDLPEEVIPISLVLELAAPKEQPEKTERSSTNRSYSSSGMMHLWGLYNLSGQHQQTFLSYVRLAKSVKSDQIDEAISTARADFRRSAQFLLATNIALEQVLRASQGNLRGENLDGIVIIWANLKKLDLKGLSFRNAFLRADVYEADLSFCDFSGSSLIDLRVEGTRFRGSTLTEAIVPAEFEWMRVENGPDLTGANWWDGYELNNQDEPKPIDPEPFDGDPKTFNFTKTFPKATQEEERKKLLAGSTN